MVKEVISDFNKSNAIESREFTTCDEDKTMFVDMKTEDNTDTK